MQLFYEFLNYLMTLKRNILNLEFRYQVIYQVGSMPIYTFATPRFGKAVDATSAPRTSPVQIHLSESANPTFKAWSYSGSQNQEIRPFEYSYLRSSQNLGYLELRSCLPAWRLSLADTDGVLWVDAI
jgi:hypothetical protein